MLTVQYLLPTQRDSMRFNILHCYAKLRTRQTFDHVGLLRRTEIRNPLPPPSPLPFALHHNSLLVDTGHVADNIPIVILFFFLQHMGRSARPINIEIAPPTNTILIYRENKKKM